MNEADAAWLEESIRLDDQLNAFNARIDAKSALTHELTNEELIVDRLTYFHAASLVNNGNLFSYVEFMIEYRFAFEAIGATGCLRALDELLPFHQEQQRLSTEGERADYWQTTREARESAESHAEEPNEFARLLLRFAQKNSEKLGLRPSEFASSME